MYMYIYTPTCFVYVIYIHIKIVYIKSQVAHERDFDIIACCFVTPFTTYAL